MSLTMQINPYLSFKGQCEAPFTFYEQCLGGQLGPIFRYAGSPMAGDAPAVWQDKIMHGSVTIGGQTLMGSALWHGCRSLRNTVVDQLRGIWAAGERVTSRARREGHSREVEGLPWRRLL